MTTQYIVGYIAGLTSIVLLDYIWLGYVIQNHISKRIGHLMRSDGIRYTPAILFYMIYVIGIIVLAINPGLQSQNIYTAIGYGALLGGIAYMTYDLTNLATLSGRPISMVVIDILRGVIVTAICSGIIYITINKLS